MIKSTNPFYKSSKWISKRNKILRRDEYECRECRRYGKTTQAVMIHHIYPLEDYPEHKLVSNNLISLCNTCHEQMHNRLTNDLSDKGIAWMKRIKL